MTINLMNPEGLPTVDLYRQVAVATGSKLVFVAGQVAVNADGETVGAGDLATQVEQCYRNVATALAEAGASFDDVVKLTIYVVDLTPDKMPLFAEGIARAAATLGVIPRGRRARHSPAVDGGCQPCELAANPGRSAERHRSARTRADRPSAASSVPHRRG